MPIVEWKRPHDIYTPIQDEDPVMMKDGSCPGDVKQGELGDCWLLGALMVLATNSEMLQNLVYFDGIKFGFSVFRFFKNGRWQFVIVDTRIPYHQAKKEPLYAHCTDPQEFWVPLMEKAYAKLHGCYQSLVGGSMAQGMVDLTGGVSEKYNLKAPEMKASLEGNQFWKDLKKYSQ